MGISLLPERTSELAAAAPDKVPTPIASAGAGSAGRGVRCVASIPCWSSSAPPPGASKVSCSTSAISSTFVTFALNSAIRVGVEDGLLKKRGRIEPLGSTAPKALATDARLIWRCGSWWKAFCPRRGPNVSVSDLPGVC